MRDRFFVEGVHAAGDRVVLAADDARKLATVLRRRSGDRVQIVDSGGSAFAATLDVDGRAVGATLDAELARPGVETALRVTIAQAVPKGQKMDFVVEKATELGAHAIVPVRSLRVVGSETSPAKVERWRRIAKSAAQQAGRTRVPDVADVHGCIEGNAVHVSGDAVVPAVAACLKCSRQVDLRQQNTAENFAMMVRFGWE